MRLLRVVGSLTLPCGCLVGRYEAYSGQTVTFLDSKGERCEVAGHRLGRMIAVALPLQQGPRPRLGTRARSTAPPIDGL